MEITWLSTSLCLLFLSFAFNIFLQRRRIHPHLPPSPPAIPILGHLHLLLKPPIHRQLQSLSKKYGPIFSLRFGSSPVVIISSPSTVEECFTKNDIIFANRPRWLIGNALEIFSSNRLNMFLGTRRDEIKILLHRLYYGEDVDSEEAKRFQKIMRGIFELAGASNPGDFLPLLRWGLVNKNSMIDHLLSLQKSEPEYYTDEIIKGLALILTFAGTDTTATTIEWAMSLLLNHPDVLKKARAELDTHVGKDRLMEESDFPKLQYLRSIISETLRLFPATPLLIPHISSDNCQIGGYDIPRGTILLVNAWAIHRDPKSWKDATSFKPERFENGESEAYKLLPFGFGRRACPGAGLANRVIGLTLGLLIQCYEWERVSEKEVDMAEGKGVTMPKLEPLEAMCKARAIIRKVL
ncbi:unnamed protein product, partial [Vitis vinifera]